MRRALRLSAVALLLVTTSAHAKSVEGGKIQPARTPPCAPDVTPPVLTCPLPFGQISEECQVRPPKVSVRDACDPTPTVSMSPTGLTGAGVHTIVYTATDASGNVATCATQVQLMCPGCVAPPDDLLAWWALDETSGSIAIERESANHGSLPAGATPTTGKVDGARAFNGGWSGLTAPRVSGAHDYQDLTVTAWIRPSRTDGYREVVDFGNMKYGFAVDDGEIQAYQQVQFSSWALSTSGLNLPANQWIHVALTADPASGELRIYVDGQIVALNPNYAPQGFWPNGDWVIGRGFEGAIDEVQVYERALSAGEVLSLWEADAHGVCK